MMEITKADWKLFRSRIAEWQEVYMERLIKEYVEILNGEGAASDKFWELEKRIKNDKRNPGVLIELHKQDVPYDLVNIIDLDSNEPTYLMTITPIGLKYCQLAF